MPRISFLLFAVLFVGLPAIPLHAAAGKPNILFIMSDDHAYQAISAYGSKLNKTRNIDRIAATGMRFERCYVTNSICGPSRACLLTGKYSHKNGHYSNEREFDVEQQTFPKLLQQAGYQTALIGKWHLGTETMPTGFDHWLILQGQGFYYQPRMISSLGPVELVGYATELITEQSLAWLEHGRDREKPFLLMMHHKAPHRPWDPAPRHLGDYAETTFAEPATLFDDYQHRASAAKKAEMRIADHMVTIGPDLKAWDQTRLNTKRQSQERNWFYNRMTVPQEKAWKKSYLRKNEPF